MAYRAENQTAGAVRRESTSKKKLTLSRLRKADTACTVRIGDGGGEECLLPDAVSEIRCRRAEEIPG